MATERKRPWYLVVALLAALVFGTNGAYEGWSAAAVYYATVDVQSAGDGIADEHDRALVIEKADAELQAVDHARARGWPVAIAELLLGMTMVMLALRALGGSGGARSTLVQVVVAQAAIGIAAQLLLHDVLDAKIAWVEADTLAKAHALRGTRDDVPLPSMRVMHTSLVLLLGAQTFASALVVLGLTRRRAREWYDGTRPAVEG